ncbi:MAG: T9SS type A sorting domain-containing protein [Bacteroidota bacterium]|nr:T9SS type A sorting domain-containing protein [Bacteroidota bacterium]
MLRKLFTYLILSSLLIIGVLKAQDPGPPVLGPDEKYTSLWSVSYDYQTNGSVRYLAQDPANGNNWCAIIMSQQDSSTPIGTQRYIYYAYSDDNGSTWGANVLDVSTSMGFPCLTLTNGIPVIAGHRSSALGTFVFKDLQFGGFSFEVIPGVPVPSTTPPIWPHIAGTTNGNLVMAGAENPALLGYRTTYTTSWSPYENLAITNGPSGNFDVAAGPNGKVSIIGTNSNDASQFAWYQSNDNGVIWDNGNEILQYIIDGDDTLFANLTGGYQAVYDDAGAAHIIFAAYNAFDLDPVVTNRIRYVKPRIYHWNSQTSALTIIAAESNIPALEDTLTQVNMVPLTQPTVTKSPSGRLTVAFTAFLAGNTQVVDDGTIVNTGEIFGSYSNDNGSTWSTPVNLTNTPGIEEKHPSLSPQTSTDSLRLYYVRDLKAGPWSVPTVSAWGKAPVYGIFLSRSLTGIRENVSVAKSFELFQNYPNPFNPTTAINYYIQKTGLVTLKVYDMLGREVVTLVNEIQTQGSKEITFNGANFSSGIYYYSITTGDFKDTKKMMLIK